MFRSGHRYSQRATRTIAHGPLHGTKRIFDLPQAEEKRCPSNPTPKSIMGPPPRRLRPRRRKPGRATQHAVESNDTPRKQISMERCFGAAIPSGSQASDAKSGGTHVKPLKPAAAKHPGSNGQPRQIANKAKATPVNPLNTEPAPIADPKAKHRRPSQAGNQCGLWAGAERCELAHKHHREVI